MIEKIRYIITTETTPYKNLALEEYLLHHAGENECILYLWQNEKTVVIGKNQNPWKECKTAELEAAGGRLVRRLSGGGAVFHDLGNLNFTFLAAKDNYNVERQLDVILEAVRLLGIPAEKTGRNDISVEGRKFSGNAFYSDGNHSYHHGTILVNVDMVMLSHYLNVSRDKLVSKGVKSVRSRVTNLTEYNAALTIDRMKMELIKAFQKIYDRKPELIELDQINQEELMLLEQKFSSWDWIYGRKLEFNYSISHRFLWGDIDMKLEIQSGRIKDCIIYSDALITEPFEQIPAILKDCEFSSAAIAMKLGNYSKSLQEVAYIKDMIQLILDENI